MDCRPSASCAAFPPGRMHPLRPAGWECASRLASFQSGFCRRRLHHVPSSRSGFAGFHRGAPGVSALPAGERTEPEAYADGAPAPSTLTLGFAFAVVAGNNLLATAKNEAIRFDRLNSKYPFLSSSLVIPTRQSFQVAGGPSLNHHKHRFPGPALSQAEVSRFRHPGASHHSRRISGFPWARPWPARPLKISAADGVRWWPNRN